MRNDQSLTPFVAILIDIFFLFLQLFWNFVLLLLASVPCAANLHPSLRCKTTPWTSPSFPQVCHCPTWMEPTFPTLGLSGRKARRPTRSRPSVPRRSTRTSHARATTARTNARMTSTCPRHPMGNPAGLNPNQGTSLSPRTLRARLEEHLRSHLVEAVSTAPSTPPPPYEESLPQRSQRRNSPASSAQRQGTSPRTPRRQSGTPSAQLPPPPSAPPRQTQRRRAAGDMRAPPGRSPSTDGSSQ